MKLNVFLLLGRVTNKQRTYLHGRTSVQKNDVSCYTFFWRGSLVMEILIRRQLNNRQFFDKERNSANIYIWLVVERYVLLHQMRIAYSSELLFEQIVCIKVRELFNMFRITLGTFRRSTDNT